MRRDTMTTIRAIRALTNDTASAAFLRRNAARVLRHYIVLDNALHLDVTAYRRLLYALPHRRRNAAL